MDKLCSGSLFSTLVFASPISSLFKAHFLIWIIMVRLPRIPVDHLCLDSSCKEGVIPTAWWEWGKQWRNGSPPNIATTAQMSEWHLWNEHCMPNMPSTQLLSLPPSPPCWDGRMPRIKAYNLTNITKQFEVIESMMMVKFEWKHSAQHGNCCVLQQGASVLSINLGAIGMVRKLYFDWPFVYFSLF